MNVYCVLLMVFLSSFTMAVEQRPFDVLSKHGKIEIRQYHRIVVAEVAVKGSRRTAASAAFRILFKFISGNNEFNQKISMTAPVAQVLGEDKLWRVSFFMPANITYDNVPKPLSEEIEIKQYPKSKVAVIRFSGSGSQDNLDKHEKRLKDFVVKRNVTVDSNPIYAFYNPPYIPWFLRRNEVMYVLLD